MGLIILAWCAYLFLVFQVINHRIVIGGFVLSLVIVAVPFFVLFFWTLHRLTTPKKAQRKAAQRAAEARLAADQAAVAAANSGSITFRVAGTTFKNEDGEKRQDILRHMKFGDKPYADAPDDLCGELEKTDYNGELAIAVIVNGYQVGFVPKSNISRVCKAMKDADSCAVSEVRVTGGGNDSEGNPLNYGCEIILDY